MTTATINALNQQLLFSTIPFNSYYNDDRELTQAGKNISPVLKI